MVTALNQMTKDYEDKFHDFDGITGYIIILFRIGLYIYFCFGAQGTYSRLKKK